MGIGDGFGKAFAKAQIAAGNTLPLEGNVFISVRDEDKAGVLHVARELDEMGFNIIATRGTVRFLVDNGVEAEYVHKVNAGRPHIVDKIKSRKVAMVINTSFGAKSVADSYSIRRSSIEMGVPYFTTIAGAHAAARGIRAKKKEALDVMSLQEYHEKNEAAIKASL